jgi:cytosine/adenosine deaminase-related metal-dependent hydrolase
MVDPIGTIVVFADTSNVDSVFVAGRALKRSGQLVDADLEQIFQKLDESRNHILGGGGMLPDWAAETPATV